MIFRLCRSVDCNVAVSKSQTWTKDWFFFSIIIECDMKFTSSVEKISYKWALYGCKTLKTSQRVRNVQVSLDLSVISDSVEEQTDFSCFLSTVVLLNRPRSHWGRFWKLDPSEMGLARSFFFCLKWILQGPDHLIDPDLLLTKPKARSGQIRLLPVRNVTGDERAHARNKSSI